MKTRKLTDDEIAQLIAAVKPIFDRNGGDPEATKAEFMEAFTERPCSAKIQALFSHTIDILARLQTEKQERNTLRRTEAEQHEKDDPATL